MANSGTNAYLKTQILTAPPEKLQLMLYDGAIRFARQAREKLREKDYEASCELLMRAQKIVVELICGLRPEENPSLCGKLAAIYAFIYRRLVEANIEHEPALVDDAIEVLEVQRDIWLELLEKLAEERSVGREAAEPSLNARA